MLDLADTFHVGLVVEEAEASMAELSAVLGATWTDVQDLELPLLTQTGPLTARLRFAFTRGSTPRIEVLEPVPGTVWSLGDARGTAHHVGVWADDLAARSLELEARGAPRVLTFDDGSGQAARFAYHRLPSGPLVELVDATRRAELEAFYDGGPYRPA